ncbi:MAG: hypothetical protein JO041_08925 [Acidobacteria bacterium]|nr:hypothetical protein [Acidobacteriota bacterium]
MRKCGIEPAYFFRPLRGLAAYSGDYPGLKPLGYGLSLASRAALGELRSLRELIFF